MKTKTKQNNIPRSIYMRMILGDEQYEYIKDEIGVEKFLTDQFLKENKITEKILTDKDIKTFSSNWFLIVEYYKNKFGKGIRDKDAVVNLKNVKNFEDLEGIYEFRNKLFKADFIYNDEFKKELELNLKLLLKLVRKIKLEKKMKDQYLIKNKVW